MRISLARAGALVAVVAAALSTGSLAGAQTVAPAPPAVSPLGPRLISPKQLAFETNAAPDVYRQDRRPASASGAPGAKVYDANGKPLGTTQGAWFAARGSWRSSVEDGMLLVRTSFTGLVPGGRYSLFARHVAAKSMLIAPLDGSGTSSSFVASPSGTAIMTITDPQSLVRGDTILLVYHTDTIEHPKTIGHVGVDAHVQLRLVQP
jgi:hypothetical protein